MNKANGILLLWGMDELFSSHFMAWRKLHTPIGKYFAFDIYY
jgi:hypothetical protein